MRTTLGTSEDQGCEGGYAFLSSKWSSDVGLVRESCLKYTQNERTCPTTLGKECKSGLRAMNYHYVGGYYGACNERDIMVYDWLVLSVV